MSSENKEVVRSFIKEINKGNLAALDNLCSPNYLYHGTGEMAQSDLEGMKKFLKTILAGFPDLEMSIDDLVAEGDKVVYRLKIRGTHKGDVFGIPPTGKRVATRSIGITRIQKGKIVEEWENYDELGLRQQLGAIQAPVLKATKVA